MTGTRFGSPHNPHNGAEVADTVPHGSGGCRADSGGGGLSWTMFKSFEGILLDSSNTQRVTYSKMSDG